MKNKALIYKRIVSVAAVIMWMTVITLFSAQNADTSSNTSGSLIKALLEAIDHSFKALTPLEQAARIDAWQFFIRKAAHFTEYAVLGILTANALRFFTQRKPVLWCLPPAVCLIYASFDEFYQTFVPGRSGNLRDVIIDFSGGLIGSCTLLLLIKTIKPRKGKIMIRNLNENDRELYLELVREFYSSEAVLHTIPDRHFNDTFSELMRSNVYAECFILEYNGTAAGYALIAKTFSQEAGGLTIWVEELYVRPQYRSCGLGGELFAFLEKERPAKRYRLEIEPDNTRAASLYARRGYEPLGYSQMIKDIK